MRPQHTGYLSAGTRNLSGYSLCDEADRDIAIAFLETCHKLKKLSISGNYYMFDCDAGAYALACGALKKNDKKHEDLNLADNKGISPKEGASICWLGLA
jgi:hypothetical protein